MCLSSHAISQCDVFYILFIYFSELTQTISPAAAWRLPAYVWNDRIVRLSRNFSRPAVHATQSSENQLRMHRKKASGKNVILRCFSQSRQRHPWPFLEPELVADVIRCCCDMQTAAGAATGCSTLYAVSFVTGFDSCCHRLHHLLYNALAQPMTSLGSCCNRGQQLSYRHGTGFKQLWVQTCSRCCDRLQQVLLRASSSCGCRLQQVLLQASAGVVTGFSRCCYGLQQFLLEASAPFVTESFSRFCCRIQQVLGLWHLCCISRTRSIREFKASLLEREVTCMMRTS